ncbi:MAG: class I SAM-dependent methyltransferase, partial [Chloroflexia bacterium]
MSSPSNRAYLTEDYWKWTKSRRSDEQVAREIGYVRDAVGEGLPGKRVAVLGLGVGQHAIGLSHAGFEVTALDYSQFGVSEAYHAGVKEGASIRWEVVDAASGSLPLFEADAVVCVDWLAGGTEAWHRRLLRNVRSRLAPDGALVVLHSGETLRDDQEVADDGGYLLKQNYDPVTGRSFERVEVGGTEKAIEFSRRVYSTVELVALVRSAGFLV